MLRTALAVWVIATVAWLMPLGWWTATSSSALVTITRGLLLIVPGALLIAIYVRISRIAPPAAVAVVESSPARQSRPRALRPGARVVDCLVLAAAGLLLAAPVLPAMDSAAEGGAAVWLFHPLAGLLLAVRWRMSGAIAAVTLSVTAAIAITLLRVSGSVAGAGAAEVEILMAALITAAAAVTVGWLRETGWSGRTGTRPASTGWLSGSGPARGERFGKLVHHASEVVTVLLADGTRWYVSPSVTRVLGYQPDDLIGGSFFGLVHPDDVSHVLNFHLTSLTTPGNSRPIEFRVLDHDGSWRTLESVFNNLLADPDVSGVVVTSRDITERKRFEERLTRQALYDSLTALPNRGLFMERLTQALTREQQRGGQTVVMFVDLDRFKLVNDSLGHGVGDELLVMVARRLESCVRPTDTVARFGGDEFTVLIPSANSADNILHIAERMIRTVSRPFTVSGTALTIGASIGIAFGVPGEALPNELLRQADAALYRAKNAGKGRATIFDPNDDHAAGRLQIDQELRQALDSGQLRVYYQPEFDLSTNTVTGAEALIRWQHPTHGLIEPSAFITIAEENGQIVPIGRWVLETVCAQAAAWQTATSADRFIVSVNISARQADQSDLEEQVAEVLARSGLNPAALRLELTETAVMQQVDSSIATLTAIRALGVQIVLDDFGTGYSSLSHLCRLPVDRIKIDQSFVASIDSDPASAAIIEAVLVLANKLRLTVTAEGIETAAQIARLRELGCTSGQGYALSRPLASDEMTALLLARQPVELGGMPSPPPSNYRNDPT